LWLIITLASLAGLAIVALSVPLDIAMRLEVYGRPKFRVSIRWLWCTVDKEIKKGKKKLKEAKKEKPKEKRRKSADFIRILRSKGLVKHLLRLIKDMGGCIRIKGLEGDLTFGLGDPADTGFLFAFIGPVAQFLNPYIHHRLSLRPSFAGQPAFEGYLEGTARLIPTSLVLPLTRFVFSPVTVKSAKVIIGSKWKKRRK